MDLAMALAAEVGADLVVANDPDADRCAVGCPGPHGWRMLRGDEVGALLGDSPAAQRACRASTPTSIVSSSLLGTLAAAHGQEYEETLTGFKWIGRVRRARLRLRGGARLLRRARTWCVTRTASRRCCGSSSSPRELKAEGRTLLDRLDDIAREHGLHATDQLSVRVTDLAQIADAMARLRTDPAVRAGRAARRAASTTSPSGTAELPPTDGLRYRLAEGARVIVRPSAPSRRSSATSRSSSRSSRRRRRRGRGADLRRRPARRDPRPTWRTAAGL